MITRDKLVAGKKFQLDSSGPEIEILFVGERRAFLRYESGGEESWGISYCLEWLTEIPPPKKKGTVWVGIYEDDGLCSISNVRDQIPRYMGGLLARVEIPWEEGQGL